MAVHDTLHLIAVGLAALAAGAHIGRQKRGSALGLAAAILMLVAMIDAAYLNRVSIVVWTPLLLVAAIALAAVRSVRRRGVTMDGRDDVCVTTHDPLGLVAMAVLLPLMHAGSAPASDHAGHGVASGVLIAVVLSVVAAHVIGSLVASVRSLRTSSRLQYVAMGAATGFMAASAIA